MPAPPLPPDPTKHPPPTPADEPVIAAVTPVEAPPAPMVEVVMYNLLGANWKSKAQGLLSFLGLYGVGTAVAINAYASDPLIAPHPRIASAVKFAGLLVTAISGAAKWYVGHREMDAKPL